MRFYDTTFFVEEAKGIKVQITSDDHRIYPITLRILPKDEVISPSISFHMSKRQLINLKNSLINSINAMERKELSND